MYVYISPTDDRRNRGVSFPTDPMCECACMCVCVYVFRPGVYVSPTECVRVCTVLVCKYDFDACIYVLFD